MKTTHRNELFPTSELLYFVICAKVEPAFSYSAISTLSFEGTARKWEHRSGRLLGKTTVLWQDPGARSKMLTFKQIWWQLKRVEAPLSCHHDWLKVNCNSPRRSTSATDKYCMTGFSSSLQQGLCALSLIKSNAREICGSTDSIIRLKVGQRSLEKVLHAEAEEGGKFCLCSSAKHCSTHVSWKQPRF